MPTYTRKELVTASLGKLNALGSNTAPSAEDYKLGNSTAQQVLELLKDRGLLPFDIDGSITPRYYLPLVDLVAFELIPNFGELDASGSYAARAQRAMTLLWQYREGPVNQNPTEISSF